MDKLNSEQENKKLSWMDVPLPSYESSAFTPKAGPDFIGIKIWAPERISLKTSKHVPLFGIVQFKEEMLNEINVSDRHPVRAVVVGAIVAGVNQPYVGNAVLQAPLFPAPKASPLVTEYFNIDIVESTGMLRAPGKYFLFASIGPFVAEIISIEVVAS